LHPLARVRTLDVVGSQGGFRCIKIHRYWLGYLLDQEPIITNIQDEVAGHPRPCVR